MKKIILSLIVLLETTFLVGQTFTLKSDDVGGQATIVQEFYNFGCVGQNSSPQLSWENPPAGTKSFAVTIYDPDAPIQSVTDFGKPGDGVPCPPKGHGIHQYIITVYALNKEKLGLDANATPASVGFNLNKHTIQKASIVMYYERD